MNKLEIFYGRKMKEHEAEIDSIYFDILHVNNERYVYLIKSYHLEFTHTDDIVENIILMKINVDIYDMDFIDFLWFKNYNNNNITNFNLPKR